MHLTCDLSMCLVITNIFVIVQKEQNACKEGLTGFDRHKVNNIINPAYKSVCNQGDSENFARFCHCQMFFNHLALFWDLFLEIIYLFIWLLRNNANNYASLLLLILELKTVYFCYSCTFISVTSECLYKI